MSIPSKRPLHLLGTKAHGPACPDPDCGSTFSHKTHSGFTSEDQFVRYRKCYGCGKYYGTIEVPIPEETSFYKVCESLRLLQRERYRRLHGKTGRQEPGRYHPSDVLDVTIKVRRVVNEKKINRRLYQREYGRRRREAARRKRDIA